MTDTIPEMYLAEAVRRLNENDMYVCYLPSDHTAKVVARTLKELGWTLPIDEQRMAKARKVAAAVCEAVSMTGIAADIRTDNPAAFYRLPAIQAAYNALGED